MNFDGKADNIRSLLERLPGLDEKGKIIRTAEDEPVPFDELAEEGILLDPKYPLALGPTMLKLLRLALTERLDLYEALRTLTEEILKSHIALGESEEWDDDLTTILGQIIDRIEALERAPAVESDV